MMRLRCAFLLSVCCVAGCGPETVGSDWRRLEQPVEAPDFTLAQLDGPPVSLSDYRGRVVIMEFWATWCGPCRMSTPSLEAVYKQHRDKPVTILLVNAGESIEKIRSWTTQRFTAPILLDADGEVQRRYSVGGIPQLFIIDQRGVVIYRHGGYRGGLERNLRLILHELLAGQEVSNRV